MSEIWQIGEITTEGENAFVIDNIETDTVVNTDYRRVVFTTPQFQLVYMSLEVGEDIPAEVHTGTTQFFRLESGTANIVVNGRSNLVKEDSVFIVPPDTEHYVANASTQEPLKMYVIYSPPVHAAGEIDQRQPPPGSE